MKWRKKIIVKHLLFSNDSVSKTTWWGTWFGHVRLTETFLSLSTIFHLHFPRRGWCAIRCRNGHRGIFARSAADARRLCPHLAHDAVYSVPPQEAAKKTTQHQPRTASVRAAASVRHVIASVDVTPVRHPLPAATGHALYQPSASLHRCRWQRLSQIHARDRKKREWETEKEGKKEKNRMREQREKGEKRSFFKRC